MYGEEYIYGEEYMNGEEYIHKIKFILLEFITELRLFCCFL